MRHSNLLVRLGVVCGCGLVGPLAADELTLSDGARLTGTVRTINEAGVVELASELSPEPVRIKQEAVAKVEFSGKGAAPKPPSALVELANGDQLAATLETLDDLKLTLVSPEAGRLELPRAALKSLQLGIQQRKVVYAGPQSLEEWTRGEGAARNWAYERRCLIANGSATASKNVGLPQQFIMRFALRWQAKLMPNFQIYFADPLKAKGERCDRYYLQFGAAGLELKREAAKGKRFNTIMQLNRMPNQYPDHQLQVELRVDRKGSRLQLILNDEPEGEWADPIPAVPEGSGVALICNTQNGSPQEIRDIEILEFDDVRSRQRSEERGDPKTDSLLSREDDRWGGRLLEIRQAGDGQVFRFKSDFQKDLLEIPAAEVSMVFFAAPGGNQAPAPAAPSFVLHLRGGGALRVVSCLFSEDAVAAVHPLLGPLTLRRDGIVAMERAVAKPKTAAEP